MSRTDNPTSINPDEYVHTEYECNFNSETDPLTDGQTSVRTCSPYFSNSRWALVSLFLSLSRSILQKPPRPLFSSYFRKSVGHFVCLLSSFCFDTHQNWVFFFWIYRCIDFLHGVLEKRSPWVAHGCKWPPWIEIFVFGPFVTSFRVSCPRLDFWMDVLLLTMAHRRIFIREQGRAFVSKVSLMANVKCMRIFCFCKL